MIASQRTRSKEWFLYLLPALGVFTFSTIVPLGVTAVISFFKWKGTGTMSFIGLANYAYLLRDQDFWLSFQRNLILIAYTAAGQLTVGFASAVLLSSTYLRGREFFRTILFIPVILSSVVVGFLWLIIYNSQNGLLNGLLKFVGLQRLILSWLEDPRIVMQSIAVVKIWQYFGLHMVVMLAAIQGIPKDVLETAELDGATGLKKSIYIVLPLIWGTIKVLLMIAIAGNMKEFDHVYVLTGGGPGKSSMVVAMYAYFNSIQKVDLGYGGAVAVGILTLSFALILLSRAVTGRGDRA